VNEIIEKCLSSEESSEDRVFPKAKPNAIFKRFKVIKTDKKPNGKAVKK
jgi:hypothetical protein